MNFTNVKDVDNLITDFVDLKTLEKIDDEKRKRICRKNNLITLNSLKEIIFEFNLNCLETKELVDSIYDENLLENNYFIGIFTLYDLTVKCCVNFIKIIEDTKRKMDIDFTLKLFIFSYEYIFYTFIDKNIELPGIDTFILTSLYKIFNNINLIENSNDNNKMLKLSRDYIDLLNIRMNKNKLLKEIKNQ